MRKVCENIDPNKPILATAKCDRGGECATEEVGKGGDDHLLHAQANQREGWARTPEAVYRAVRVETGYYLLS